MLPIFSNRSIHRSIHRHMCVCFLRRNKMLWNGKEETATKNYKCMHVFCFPFFRVQHTHVHVSNIDTHTMVYSVHTYAIIQRLWLSPTNYCIGTAMAFYIQRSVVVVWMANVQYMLLQRRQHHKMFHCMHIRQNHQNNKQMITQYWHAQLSNNSPILIIIFIFYVRIIFLW